MTGSDKGLNPSVHPVEWLVFLWIAGLPAMPDPERDAYHGRRRAGAYDRIGRCLTRAAAADSERSVASRVALTE